MANLLYSSLRDKLLPLPDSSLVYPAHGAGSLCGKALSKETVSTIGEQRRSNYALQPMTKEAFIELVTADQPDAPPYFTYDAVLNSRERQTLDEALARELRPLTIDELLAEQARGAQVLDTRDPAEFAAAHLARQHQHRPDRAVRDVGRHRARRANSRSSSSPIRAPRPSQRCASGASASTTSSATWRAAFEAPTPLRPGLSTTERIGADVAAQRMASTAPPSVVDVRSVAERTNKRIEGSLHIPLNHLAERLGEIPADRPVLVHCAGGYRSSIAASLLQRAGRTHVSELAGGITAWEAAGLPTQTG